MPSFRQKQAHWLNLAVFSANDGMVTTFAVVAGVSGAHLSEEIILIMGFANIAADSLSMALGNYLGEQSESRALSSKQKVSRLVTLSNSGVILLSFALAGLIPLVPFLLHLVGLYEVNNQSFLHSLLTTAVGMFIIGSLRTMFTKGSWLRNGLEMLGIGMTAATVAYLMGSVVSTWLP